MEFIVFFSYIIFVALIPAVGMSVHWLGSRVGELVQAKVELVQAQLEAENLRAALLRLDVATVTAVKDLEQTLAAECRASSKSGKLCREDRVRIREAAVSNAKSYLGSSRLKDLEKTLGVWDLRVDEFIAAKIEATLYDLKRGAATSAPKESSASDKPPTTSPPDA